VREREREIVYGESSKKVVVTLWFASSCYIFIIVNWWNGFSRQNGETAFPAKKRLLLVTWLPCQDISLKETEK
jgi:hypothetical protein